MELTAHLDQLLWTVIYALLGMLIFASAFAIMVRVTPFSIRKEIEDDQNIALAIVMGSMFVGLSIIIAAAIAG